MGLSLVTYNSGYQGNDVLNIYQRIQIVICCQRSITQQGGISKNVGDDHNQILNINRSVEINLPWCENSYARIKYVNIVNCRLHQ